MAILGSIVFAGSTSNLGALGAASAIASLSILYGYFIKIGSIILYHFFFGFIIFQLRNKPNQTWFLIINKILIEPNGIDIILIGYSLTII